MKAKKLVGIFLFILMCPVIATAWWQEDWAYKKKISFDTTKLKQEGITVPESGFALIRLHTGNFLSFLELAEKGKDIRVLAGDEKTPLKFFIEKLDPLNDMALIWVQLPKDIVASPEPAIWLYFGNEKAVDGQDKSGSFPLPEVLNYQFNDATVIDATANANNPSESTAILNAGGLIAGSADFKGEQIIKLPAKPSLQMNSSDGWSISLWIKIDQAQQSVLFQRVGTDESFSLSLKDQVPVIDVSKGSALQQFAGKKVLDLGSWHHIAVTYAAENLNLYVDGIPDGVFPVKLGDLTGDATIGNNAEASQGFAGSMDQFSVYKAPLDANTIKYNALMQGPGSVLLAYGFDETPDSEGEGGDSYILSTLDNVTVDGWVIIGILAVMFVISWMVMIVKAIVVNRNHKENRLFEQSFSKLGSQDMTSLNEANEDEDEDDTSSLFSLCDNHSTYKHSSIYKVYHTGVEEMNKRILKSVGAAVDKSEALLSEQSMAAVKASMDAVVVRELQKLNSMMVLLTIAISGGPFLGLLGTVVGVMITFASIAASGEINVNAIAPGIAAALVATVAGLLVAIPALFGYNYLGSRIKMVSADLNVFVDEFVAKLAEQHT
jgi:biopolymer transport protein ExbB